MTTEIILHELPPSPNNLKVRMALGFKRIEYTRAPIPMTVPHGDRTALIALSSQPRTPVLQHGETVIFESNGIIRYLEANVKREPQLFSSDYAEMGEIEKWELFVRTRLGAPIGRLFGVVRSGDFDADVITAANDEFHAVTAELEEQLAESNFLVGGRTTNADLAVSSIAHLATLSDSEAAANPIMSFFHAQLRLGAERERTRAWIERHVALDGA